MYKNILIPTDGSDLSDKAVQYGSTLAKALGAKVTALTVSLPFQVFTFNTGMVEDTSADYKKRAQDFARKTLDAVANTAKATGVPCETVHVQHEHPYQAIIDTAKSKGCDLIVMASHGPWYLGNGPGQRDRESAHPLEDPRAGTSLMVSRVRRRFEAGLTIAACYQAERLV